MKRIMPLIVAAACLTAAAARDDDYNSFRDSLEDDYNSFLTSARDDYASFRDKANSDYSAFLTDSNWVPASPCNPLPRPADNSLRPTTPAPRHDLAPLTIDEIITPDEPTPRPEPLQPIPYRTLPGTTRDVAVDLFGTRFTLPLPVDYALSLPSPSAASIGRAWKVLSDQKNLDPTIGSLLRLRDSHSLCDWAYFCLVRGLAAELHGADSPEAALFTAYVMNQSGYANRLAYDSRSGRIYAMFGTENLIFEQQYFPDGKMKYYPFASLGSVQMVSADYPGTRGASMLVTKLPELADRPERKSLTVKHHPQLKFDYVTNRNLMDFFSSYPASALSDNTRTKWAYYALTPLSQPVADAIYPGLHKAIAGLSQQQAADILMDFCESLPYAADDDMWGCDRAFFPDETLFYGQGDCEDHAILFVRLVRDLMGLDAALLYFPRHLAAAVLFTDNVPGDYVDYGGARWTVCDPTIFYSGVGHMMNGCDGSRASLIPLTGLK